MAIGQADVSVIAGEQSCGVTRVIVFRMAGEFRAKLVVPKTKSERAAVMAGISVAGWKW